MADAPGLLLLHQIIEDAVFLIQIGVNVHLADVVEQIKVEILHPAFLQLLLKNLLHLVHVRQVIAWELGGQIEALPRVLFQSPAHDQL